MQCTSKDLTEDVTWIGDVPVLDEPHAWLLRRLNWERRLAELEGGCV